MLTYTVATSKGSLKGCSHLTFMQRYTISVFFSKKWIFSSLGLFHILSDVSLPVKVRFVLSRLLLLENLSEFSLFWAEMTVVANRWCERVRHFKPCFWWSFVTVAARCSFNLSRWTASLFSL